MIYRASHRKTKVYFPGRMPDHIGLAAAGPVRIRGHYMLADGQDYSCTFGCLTSEAAEVIAAKHGDIGERIVVYLKDIGMMIGRIDHLTRDGFNVSLQVAQERRAHLRARIAWYAHSHPERVEPRDCERTVPAETAVRIRLASGREFPASIIDVWRSGAAVYCICADRIEIGDPIRLGEAPGTVVRRIENGFAVRFLTPSSADGFIAGLTL